MITYELMLLFRVMPKPELRTVLKRTTDTIFQKGGIIRKIENLGSRDMPYKTSCHGLVHRKASYFLYEFNVPPSSIDELLDEYIRDVDIIRRRIFKKNEPESFECTLDEELKPVPYREDVKELLKKAHKKWNKQKFTYSPDLDYYPFQK